MQRNLSRDRVVDAALELIDEEGIGALSMRRLGSKLGVEGMALYTHVSSKADLLDAVGGRVADGLDTAFDPALPWQERILRGARSWAALQERHPRAFPLVYREDHQSDAVSLLTEELLGALRTAGFDAPGAALAYQTIVVFVDGALLGRGTWTDDELESAWRRGAARVDPTHYPRFAEIAPHAARLSWDEILESGLSLLLDGLQARLVAAGGTARPAG
jgi:AcrR family transcriptional regulator